MGPTYTYLFVWCMNGEIYFPVYLEPSSNTETTRNSKSDKIAKETLDR